MLLACQKPSPPAAREEGAESPDEGGVPAVPIVDASERGDEDAGSRPVVRRVLHTGDSMVGSHGGLTRALRRRFEGIGAEFVSDHKTSASITTFARSPHLDQLLGAHDPDLVVLTLGANDARAPRPEVFAPAVAQVVAKLAGRACVWIGPPLGTPRGISRVIRENAGHCAFFDSSELVIRRGPDGVHPTDRGGAEWADAFWAAFYPAGDGADGGDSGRDGSAPP